MKPLRIKLKPTVAHDTNALREEKLPRLAYSINETALMLGLSEKTIRRLIDRQKLKANKSLRHIRISRTEINRFLESE